VIQSEHGRVREKGKERTLINFLAVLLAIVKFLELSTPAVHNPNAYNTSIQLGAVPAVTTGVGARGSTSAHAVESLAIFELEVPAIGSAAKSGRRGSVAHTTTTPHSTASSLDTASVKCEGG
jgi:hypothetical protein